MKFRRHKHRAWTVAAALSALMIATGASAAEKFVYATYLSDTYSASRTDLWFTTELEKRSNGEIKFERYWSQSLVKAPELFPSLRSGAADIVGSAPAAYNVREYPLANVLMPLMSKSGDAVTFALNRLYAENKHFRHEFESKGAKVLYSQAWAENTAWSRRPITKADDFKGLKVRAVPVVSDVLVKIGATPVALVWSEGIEGLQRGVVDVMSSAPFDSSVHGNVQDVATYGTDAGGVGIFAIATTAISLDRYNRLNEKHRKLVDELAAEAPKKAVEFLNQSIDNAVEKLCTKKDKITVTIFSAEEAEKIRDMASGPLQEAWIKRANAEAKVDGKAMLDEFLSYVRDYEKTSTYVPGFQRFLQKCGKS